MKTLYATIIALASLIAPIVADSCSCASIAKSEKEEVQLLLKSAEAVVLAEAVSIETFPSKFDAMDTQSQRVRWKVVKSWKGPHSRDQIIVSETVVTCCLCGVPAQKGEVFLIFRHGPEPFSISNCSRSGPASRMQTQISLLDRLASTHDRPIEPAR
jgi:hypothetical protein